MTKKVSVIIPTLNRNDILINTLKDLLLQDYPDFEIVVIDQTEQTRPELMDFIKKYPRIKYIHQTEKSSPRARNTGVQNATGEILLFLDDDVEIKAKDFIASHIENYQDPKIGLVGGRVIYNWEDNISYKEVGRLKYWGLKEITNFDSTQKTKIDHAPGGNLSVIKTIFEQVGGFSEIYKGNAHMEETDFCLMVRRAGHKMVFEPKAVLRHLQASSGGNRAGDLYEFRYWLVHNYVVFYLKNYPKILFSLCFIKEFIWAAGSGLKRGDFKMFKIMYTAINDGIKYHRSLS